MDTSYKDSKILEESETVSGNRVATVRTSRGEEYLIDVDRLVCSMASAMSDRENEVRFGWTLNGEWYKDKFYELSRDAVHKEN
jgi:hypothetical protein